MKMPSRLAGMWDWRIDDANVKGTPSQGYLTFKHSEGDEFSGHSIVPFGLFPGAGDAAAMLKWVIAF